MNLKESLNQFIANKDMHCFLLRGQWGVGKTYAVNEWAAQYDGNKDINVIKLPLFGISSINELNSLALNSSSLLNKFLSYLKSLNQDVSAGAGPVNVSVPLIGAVANLLKETYPKSKKKKFIFIIDDIERKDFKLSIEEIFGFVDQLPFENTKVILISNTDKLIGKKDKKSFELFKEKVVQSEFYIDAPEVDVIKNVAGDSLFKLIQNHLEFTKNLRTIIKLKNILSSIGEIDELVVQCTYLSLLSIDECVFSKGRLKEIYIEEYKESERFFGPSFEKRMSLKEIESKVEERLEEIKNDSDVFYENIKSSNILPNFPQTSLRDDVIKIYRCVEGAFYDELKSIRITPVNPYKKIKISWDSVFYAGNPTKEYLKCMNEVRGMFNDVNYDQVKVFKTYYSLKFNCEKYIKRTKDIQIIEKTIEKDCVHPVAESLIKRDYEDDHDALNSFFLTGNIPQYLQTLESKIFSECFKIAYKTIRAKIVLGSLTINDINYHFDRLMRIIGHDCKINEINWDNFLLSKIRKIFKSFSGNVESVWSEAHQTFKWINEHKDKCDLSKTIDYIIKHSEGTSIDALRFSFLLRDYGFGETTS